MKNILAIMYLSLALYMGYNMVFAEKPEYQNAAVIVSSGDTLWDIASRYRRPGEDVRDIVDRIREANNLGTGHIYPGQGLLVPALVENGGARVAVK